MQNPEQLQRIRDRAFALYLARQRAGQDNEGSELEDWLRAEKEMADTVRTARPQFAQNYGGDGMSSGPEPETPDPATLREASPSDNAGARNGGQPRDVRDKGKANNDSARRRH